MLIIYVIFWSIVLIIIRKKILNPSFFLVSLYFLSSIFALILMYGFNTYNIDRIKLPAVLYHILTLSLCMFPVVRFGYYLDIRNVTFPPLKKLNMLVYILIALGFLGISTSIFRIYDLIISGNFLENRDLFLKDPNSISPKNIFEFLGRVGAALSFYSVFLGIYYYTLNKKLLSLLLFIASLSTIFINALASGRQTVIYWIFQLAASITIFWKILSHNQKKKLIKYISIPTFLVIIYFTLVSVNRFGSENEGTFFHQIDYIGQQNIYFSYGYDKFYDNTFGGKRVFPILFQEKERINGLSVNDIKISDYSLNTFSTFIGDIYSDIGNLGTLIFSICFFLITAIIFFRKKNIYFLQLCFFLIFYEIINQGLFYFMHSSTTLIKSHIFFIFLIILTKLTIKVKKANINQ